MRRHLRKAKARQKHYHDQKATHVEYEVGDTVYVHNNQRSTKLQDKWETHYVIIQQTSHVSFLVENQLTEITKKYMQMIFKKLR